MKAKTKKLLYAENHYLKTILLLTIQSLKKLDIPVNSEIMKSEKRFTEIHKILIGNYFMWYNLEELFELDDTSIAYVMNDAINKDK